jgi:predicted membrane-bound spermidine synthase
MRRLLLIAFTISGFSGLIYESLWTHYLKLFLGHAAYSQTLVLTIFMGGLAIGSWICSRRAARWSNPLRGYAVTEAVIGLVALAFHPVYMTLVDAAYASAIPALGSVTSVTVFKWALGAALIFPQSVLLGMTFPLMAGGFIRAFPVEPGRSLGLLYFCNSIGGVVGVLASGFYLVPHLGLPTTVVLAGVLNLLIGLAVWLAAPAASAQLTAESRVTNAPPPGRAVPVRLLILVSALTGTASFVYEIGWIRMLSLVLGSSTQAFELMLSAFILGLACGGLWIRRRADRLPDPVRFLGVVQVAMGSLALATLPLYQLTFSVMRTLVAELPRTDLGYVGFNLASHAIAMAIMLPATFFAGSTLPLITFALLRGGHGERSIGSVYSANTIGAIVGVLVSVHIGLPLLGLKLLIAAGAALDIALGLVLLWRMSQGRTRMPYLITAAAGGWLGLIALGVTFDPRVTSAGVFRANQRAASDGYLVLFHRDGKTATVDVTDHGTSVAIRTNGKIDATVNMSSLMAPTLDEPTQVMSAALPLLIHPGARTAANIGLGSGVTTHVLLAEPSLEVVDTVEIESGMIEGAEQFRPRNERTFTDPRSRIHPDDAKTFFSTNRRRYDIIVSEPSNPWVSGTAGLFSTEFYQLIGRYLAPGGVFVQWLQLYEFDSTLVASVLKAVGEHFDDYAIYSPATGDMLIVATRGQAVPAPDADFVRRPQLAADLRRVNIESLQDLMARKIADRQVLEPWLATMPVRAHSDFHPVLDHRAARARFLNVNALEVAAVGLGSVPVGEMLGQTVGGWASTRRAFNPFFPGGADPFVAMEVRDQLTGALPGPPLSSDDDEKRLHAGAARLLSNCTSNGDPEAALYRLGSSLAGYLRKAELETLWPLVTAQPCGQTAAPLTDRWMTLFRAVGSRHPAEMASAAEGLLATEPAITDPERRAYVVAVGMLGSLAMNQPQRARTLWRTAAPQPSSRGLSFVLSVLAAQAGATEPVSAVE